MRRLIGSALAAAFLFGCGNDSSTVGLSAPTDVPADPTPTPVPVSSPPFVFLHGMAGFDTLGPIEYWHGIPDAIRNDGRVVYVLDVDAVSSVAVRAQQAGTQIDAILAASGAAKVHLITHSQGGLDARHMISALGYGDRVATLTTISGPHHGTPVADVALGLIPGPALDALTALLAILLDPVSTDPADLSSQLTNLSRTWADDVFNPATPDDPRVAYYSAAGRTQPYPWLQSPTVDVVNPALAISYAIVYANEGDNDGMVSVESATWGTFLGIIPADHGDEIGWGLNLPLGPAFDAMGWYRGLAGFLAGEAPPP